MTENERKKNVKLMRAFIAYREDLIIAAYNDTEGQDSKWYYGMDAETEAKYFEKFLSLVNYNDENMVIVTSEPVKS
tara:strand:- start:1276 stop:1503 length:228 start_codon:yes stop_codon:yes gene_type:complete